MKLAVPVARLADQIRTTGQELAVQKSQAIMTAVHLGAMLNELKGHVGHGPFITMRRELLPGISDDTCERYMKTAANAVALSGITIDISVTKLLGAPDSELSEPQLEARQTLFSFMEGTTIKECLAAVVVDGDEPHRITRAANGKKLGGHKGEDRKDWPKYIGIHLKDITAHLKSYKSFTPAQVESVIQKFGVFFSKCPDLLLGELKKQITEELKSR